MKLSLGKNNTYFEAFSNQINAMHMGLNGFGLNIDVTLSSVNQLRAAFRIVMSENGYVIFNISGVDLERANTGFHNTEEAFDNNMITEWELSYILQNQDILERTIFHNGRVRFLNDEIGILYKWS